MAIFKKSKKKTKLHLGCGEKYLDGYVNIDFPPTEHRVQIESKADEFADIRKLTYAPESIDEIRSHHVFEHFDRSTSLGLLINWYMWLKDGGQLIIETPDFEKCAEAFLASGSQKERLLQLRHMLGSHEADWAYHLDGWDESRLKDHLETLGFGELIFERTEWKNLFSITVRARKRPPHKSPGELKDAAKKLLELSLVDDSPSELRLLKTWVDRLQPGIPVD